MLLCKLIINHAASSVLQSRMDPLMNLVFQEAEWDSSRCDL